MPLTTKPFLTGGASAFPYFGAPTNVGSTLPYQVNPGQNGWGNGWGGLNPFGPPRAPSYIVDIWKKALDSEDYGTLDAMSSDSNIRHHLARALGINVNQLANIAMSKFKGQYGTTASKWTPQMSSAYYQQQRMASNPFLAISGQGGLGTGGTQTANNPYAGMTTLYRDSTGMLHDPGNNPIPTTTNTPNVYLFGMNPYGMGNGRGNGNFGWRHGGGGGGRGRGGPGSGVSDTMQGAMPNPTTPNAGTQPVVPPPPAPPPQQLAPLPNSNEFAYQQQ